MKAQNDLYDKKTDRWREKLAIINFSGTISLLLSMTRLAVCLFDYI